MEARKRRHALLQHHRPRQARQALLHPTAGTFRPGRGPSAGGRREVLRAARPPADGQDLLPPGALRPAEQAGLRLRVHHRRDRADGPRRRGAGDAHGPLRTGLGCTLDAGGRFPGQGVVRHPRRVRPQRGATRGAEALGGGVIEAAGAAHRRDRHPPGRPAALGAATATCRLPHAPEGVSAVRGAVRAARRARLPHPVHHQQPLQHRGEVAAAGGLRAGGDADPPRPAHRGDGAGVHAGGARGDMDPDPGPAVAGERAGLGDLLREQGQAGPLAARNRRRHRGGAGRSHRAAGDASRPVGGQAPGRPRAPGGRADAERRGRAARDQSRRRVRARPRADCPGQAGAHRQPHLRGGRAAELVGFCRRSWT